MTRRRSPMAMMVAALLALLAASAGWAWSTMAAARASALDARDGLERCGQIASRIRALQASPSMAADQELQASQTTGQAEAAARAAGIAAGGLVRISPEPAIRLGDSAYKEKPTRVFMKGVTLRQLATMIHDLAARPSPLTARSITLSAPKADDTGDSSRAESRGSSQAESREPWNVELVLTYLIYEPQKTAAFGPAGAANGAP